MRENCSTWRVLRQQKGATMLAGSDPSSEEREQFAAALEQFFDVPHEEGVRKYLHHRYESFRVENLIHRMQVFSEFFGRERAGKFFGTHPDVLRHWLERLPSHACVFRNDGIEDDDILRLFERRMELCRLEEERLKTRHVTLCVLLPDKEQRHALIKAHPEVYVELDVRQLLAKKGLPWNGSAEDYWKQLRKAGAYVPPRELPLMKPPKPVPEAQAKLETRLTEHGLLAERARPVARILFEAFGDQASDELELLLAAGWSAKDVQYLVTEAVRKEWQKGVQNLLACERVLNTLGVERDVARSLVTRNGIFSSEDPDRITPVVETLIELEGREFAVKAALHNAKWLFEEPETIRTWHAEMRRTKKKPFAVLFRIPEFTAEKHARRLALEAQRQERAAQEPKEPKPPRVHKERMRPPPTPPPPSTPPPPTRPSPDEDVRMPLETIKKADTRVIVEERGALDIAVQALCDRRFLDMSRENAANYVLFRPKMLERSEHILPMLKLLTALGYRRDALDHIMRTNPGILVVDARELEHIVSMIRSLKGFKPPADPRDLFIPLHEFQRRIQGLSSRNIPPTDPRYVAALFARTSIASEEAMRPTLRIAQ